jgi:hypothetical protein
MIDISKPNENIVDQIAQAGLELKLDLVLRKNRRARPQLTVAEGLTRGQKLTVMAFARRLTKAAFMVYRETHWIVSPN